MNFTLKTQNTHFKTIFMPVIRYNFRKTLRSDLEKSSKVLIFGPKLPPFAQYWAKQELSLKKELAHFLVFTES